MRAQMCRLFGMSGGEAQVSAQLWLLDAADSLTAQSHSNPDGTGLGIFDADLMPVVEKAPISAFEDTDFAEEARRERSRTFIGHVRFASVGELTCENTHPFVQEGRIFAHNGVLGDLDRFDEELGPDRALREGDTDSERFFTLITREIRRHDGDVRAGIVAAATWISEQVPMYSLNMVLATESELFALRYPDNNTLYVLDRDPGGFEGDDPLHQRSRLGTEIKSEDAEDQRVVVVASEPMDDDPGWRPLEPGELLHVNGELGIHSEVALPHPPSDLIKLHQMDEKAQASQTAAATGS